MKVNREKLLEAVGGIHRIATKKTTLPVLNCFQLEAKDGRLSVRATDLESDAKEEMDCDGDMDSVCVSANKLLGLISNGSDTAEITANGSTVTVSCGQEAKFQIISSEEFPPKITEKAIGIGVNCAILAKAIDTVSWATNTRCQRAIREHVGVFLSPTSIRAYGYTGHVFAMSTLSAICAKEEFMVHVLQVPQFCKALRRDGAVLKMSDKHIVVEHSGGSLHIRRPELAVMNLENTLYALELKPIGSIDRKAFLQAAKTAALFAHELNKDLAMEFKPQSVELTTQEYRTEIIGEFIEWSAKASCQLLEETLSAFEIDKLTLSRTEPHNAIRFEAEELCVYLALIRQH